MLSGVFAVLEELRGVVGPDEMARAAANTQSIERAVKKLKDLIDRDFETAVAKKTPELAGALPDIFAELAASEPGVMRGKVISSDGQKVRDALTAAGYIFYTYGNSPLEFVYAPGKTPAHLEMDELKKTKKMLAANVKAAASPDEKADHKQKIKTVDQEIKALENSDLYVTSEKAASKTKPVSDEPEPLKPTKEMKDLQKQIKAAEQEVAAATNASQRTAAEKKLADLEAQLDGETATAQKAQGSGVAPAKKGAIKDIEDPNFNPDDPNVPPETRALYWKRKRVGAYKQTSAAMDGLDTYEASLRDALSVLSKDSKQKAFNSDRQTRLTNLMKTLRDTVVSAERELEKVGVPAQPKKAAAEGLGRTAYSLAALAEELRTGGWIQPAEKL